LRGRGLGSAVPTGKPINRNSGPVVRIVRPDSGPVGYRGKKNEFAEWRKRLGAPISSERP
jgi:hypothetical protein